MATSPLTQVDPSALDLAGLSVATSVAGGPRTGSIYDATLWAAAAPVWFHPLFDGRYLMVAARRWHDATVHASTPGAYTSFTEDTTPSWCILYGPSGKRTPVPGAPLDIPRNTAVDTVTVVAAASRPPGYLYLLHQVHIGGVRQGLLQYFVANASGGVVEVAEEILPSATVGGDTVVFDRGLQYDTPYLVAYGSDGGGRIYRIRKPWSKVGVNQARSFSPQVHAGMVGTQVGWEYWTGAGYSADPGELVEQAAADTSTSTSTGAVLRTVGPLSFAPVRGGTVITTVGSLAGDYYAQAWISRGGRPWVGLGASIPLGHVGVDYLGGGLQLQPQLQAVTPNTVPCVSWRKVSAGGASSLEVHWAVLSSVPTTELGCSPGSAVVVLR